MPFLPMLCSSPRLFTKRERNKGLAILPSEAMHLPDFGRHKKVKLENENDASSLYIFPNFCQSQSFLCNRISSRRVRTLLILVLFLLVGCYTLQIRYSFWSSYNHDIEILRLYVSTGRQNLRNDLDKSVDASKDRVYFPTQQAEPGKTDEDKTFICDRSHPRTDLCQMTGDVRVHGSLRSILLFSDKNGLNHKEEKIRPYTRKWEPSVMATIDEITLRKARSFQQDAYFKCDVNHSIPAVVFSTGGYTGNVYHEFNDGLIPLFITSQHLRGEVVFLILEYHNWWMTKYGEIVKQLSRYEVLDFNSDERVHCFPHVTVGLRIHDELTIDPKLSEESASMTDFQNLLNNAYLPRIQSMNKANNDNSPKLIEPSENRYFPRSFITVPEPENRPKLVIIARNGSRAILNQVELVEFIQRVGFNVEVLTPNPRTEMVDMYKALNSCHVMLGVHGAAMTHFLFMRPGSIFIQIVPLGTDWAAMTYYGEPAIKLGLDYLEYKITPDESTLSEKYARDDPVLSDPETINSKGWMETKRVYLDGQDVRLSLSRFQRTLKEAYKRSMRRDEV